ncbi:hypothetical protein D3C71_1986540 [compost metagenome]
MDARSSCSLAAGFLFVLGFLGAMASSSSQRSSDCRALMMIPLFKSLRSLSGDDFFGFMGHSLPFLNVGRGHMPFYDTV